jgi:hypothetical protein
LREPAVDHCFPIRVSQNIVRGSARNHEKKYLKNVDIPGTIPNIPQKCFVQQLAVLE